MKTKKSWCDALGEKNINFAVITKNNRVQIIIEPTEKQCRRRGKKNWEPFAMVNSDGNPYEIMLQHVQEAIQKIKNQKQHRKGA